MAGALNRAHASSSGSATGVHAYAPVSAMDRVGASSGDAGCIRTRARMQAGISPSNDHEMTCPYSVYLDQDPHPPLVVVDPDHARSRQPIVERVEALRVHGHNGRRIEGSSVDELANHSRIDAGVGEVLSGACRKALRDPPQVVAGALLFEAGPKVGSCVSQRVERHPQIDGFCSLLQTTTTTTTTCVLAYYFFFLLTTQPMSNWIPIFPFVKTDPNSTRDQFWGAMREREVQDRLAAWFYS